MQYVCNPSSGGAVALSAATAKSVLRVASAGILYQLAELSVSFDGTSQSAVPVLVELCQDDGVSGGSSSSVTPRQVRGAAVTATVTATTYSAEPTYTNLVVLKSWLVPPTTGMLLQFPLGREVEAQPATARLATVLRLNAPAAVNVRAYMEVVQGPS